MHGMLPEIYVVLLLAGILLIGAEIYMPGAVLGVLGACCLIGAAVVGFGFGPEVGFLSAALIVLASVGGLIWWVRVFPRTGAGQRLTLARAPRDVKSPGSAESPSLVGREGVALTDLRPSGIAVIDGQRRDVTANGVWIVKGVRIKVVAAGERHIEVAPVDPPAPGVGAPA